MCPFFYLELLLPAGGESVCVQAHRRANPLWQGRV